MDEASSRFVDQLVLGRLLGEKLSKVRHRPQQAMGELLVDAYGELEQAPAPPEVAVDPQTEGFSIRSPLNSPYQENAWYRVIAYPTKNARGAILLVHGLYEENRDIYAFLVSELHRFGYSVYLTTLPYHYERKPRSSLFSGEYFFSADLGRTRSALVQAGVEVRQCYLWLQNLTGLTTFVVGFSMGATVTLSVAAKTNILRGLCLINPAAGLSEVIWTSPLCQTIRRDLFESGHDEAEVLRVLSSFDPCLLRPIATPQARIQLIYADYDLITLPRQYAALAQSWQLRNVLTCKAGHLNTLRVPRLAEDIAKFFRRLEQPQSLLEDTLS
ncbi:MAG TPA: hypothetical protein VKP30_12880 [Polyangiaceae bacterium]|nr:hypothetical protein [Polyangiaceae bacterium]